MSTPHNEANLGDFAKTVIMPGDPKRAEFIANNYLTDSKLINDVRGTLEYNYYRWKGGRGFSKRIDRTKLSIDKVKINANSKLKESYIKDKK